METARAPTFLVHLEKVSRGNTLEFSPKDEEELGAPRGGVLFRLREGVAHLIYPERGRARFESSHLSSPQGFAICNHLRIV